jgi:hypothetical protein
MYYMTPPPEPHIVHFPISAPPARGCRLGWPLVGISPQRQDRCDQWSLGKKDRKTVHLHHLGSACESQVLKRRKRTVSYTGLGMRTIQIITYLDSQEDRINDRVVAVFLPFPLAEACYPQHLATNPLELLNSHPLWRLK